ncbi:hypothetical protein VULLAG_LOCUS21156 [Vulpes lagopus]
MRGGAGPEAGPGRRRGRALGWRPEGRGLGSGRELDPVQKNHNAEILALVSFINYHLPFLDTFRNGKDLTSLLCQYSFHSHFASIYWFVPCYHQIKEKD